MSVEPWMLQWPRIAMMPPPGRPTFPSRSWRIAAARIIWTPVECGSTRGHRYRARAFGLAGRGDQVGHLEERGLRRPADPLHHLRRIAIDVLLEELEDAA